MYGFATADKDNSYTQVTSLPTLVGTYTAASAGLVTKIKQAGGHNAVVYTPSDEAAIGAWKHHAEHAATRTHGRAHWYEHFELRVARVERAYGKPQPR